MYRIYVQDDATKARSSVAQDKKADMEDPQQVFNRDREQLERSLDSLRRCTKTDAMATKRELGKMIREGVLLTRELNMLRKNARHLQLQKRAIAQVGTINAQTDVSELMEYLGLKVNNALSAPGKAGATAAAAADGERFYLLITDGTEIPAYYLFNYYVTREIM